DALSNGVLMLRPEVARQRRRREAPRHDVREVGVARDRQLGEREPRALEDARRDRAFDLGEELGIASQASHHRAAEAQLEQGAPPPRVPALTVETALLLDRARLTQCAHPAPAVDQWQDPAPEQPEVVLELAGVNRTHVDRLGMSIPEAPRWLREFATQ